MPEFAPSGALRGDTSQIGACVQVSIVIPVRNEEHMIGLCLEALCQLEFHPQAFEVILVDNGSSDGTLETARRFLPRLNMKILEIPGVYISALRNRGAHEARGEVLAFLDADCLPPRNWLTALVSRLREAPDAVIGAHYKIPRASSWVATTWYGGIETEKSGAVSYLPGGDLVVSRANFEAIGGFDESIQTNEDAEFCRRARMCDLRVAAFRELGVEHLGTPQTIVSFYRKQRWHGTHVFRLFLRERGSHNAKPVALALYTLTILIGVCAGLVIAATVGKPSVLAISICALLAVPLARGAVLGLRRKRFADVLPLALLTLVYALARAVCLVDPNNWRSLRNA